MNLEGRFAATSAALVAAAALSFSAQAASRSRQCGFSYSPDGEHVAFFTWRGGNRLELWACEGGCQFVRAYRASPALAYRWEAPDRLVVFEPGVRPLASIGRVGRLEVRAAPISAASGSDIVRIEASRRTCFIPENVVIEAEG